MRNQGLRVTSLPREFSDRNFISLKKKKSQFRDEKGFELEF